MNFHRTSTPELRAQWQETHNANNDSGVYRRSMSGPILPMPRPSIWGRFWRAKP